MPMTAQKKGYFLNWMRNSYAFEEECKFEIEKKKEKGNKRT